MHMDAHANDNFDDLFAQMRASVATGEGPDAPPAHKPMLDSIDDFKLVANRAISDLFEEQGVTPDQVLKVRHDGHQVIVTSWEPHAAGYIGKVTDGTWYSMVMNSLKAKLFQLTHRHSGKWVMLKADFDTYFKNYEERRGRFTLDQSGRGLPIEEKSFNRTERHFFIPIVLAEVTGAQPFIFDPKDGEVVRMSATATADRDLAKTLRFLRDGGGGGSDAQGSADVESLQQQVAALTELVQRLANQPVKADATETPTEQEPAETGDAMADLDAEMRAAMAQSDSVETPPKKTATRKRAPKKGV